MKETLIVLEEKYQSLSTNLTNVIARRARESANRLTNQITEITSKVQEEPSDIEKLTLLKEYMANMPTELDAMRIKMNGCFDVYKMLEEFNYRFSKEEM